MENWGVEGAVCQILELYDQNPWRNYWSKLATFDLILQRPHSALIKLFSVIAQYVIGSHGGQTPWPILMTGIGVKKLYSVNAHFTINPSKKC